MTSATEYANVKLDECFRSIETICTGLTLARIDSPHDGYLGVRLNGATRQWDIFVDCDEKELKLPCLKLGMPRGILAHVGYYGIICVNDGQGLSLDPDRKVEIVAHTVLAGYNLLEASVVDSNNGLAEFYNEFEGYWSGLPRARKGRAAFEVDGNDRLLTAHVDKTTKQSKIWFTEFGKTIPSEFRVDKTITQRALYVHLNEPLAPPAYPDLLNATFIEDVRQCLTPPQLDLWNRLVDSSKNGPKRVALLLSVPRIAGGRSVVGAEFGARAGRIDSKAPIVPLTIRRHTPAYMRERGGASLGLLAKHIVVLGCGSVGSVVADALASSGVGRLTLVDHEDFTEDNVFRHELGPFWVDYKKVLGLQLEFERRYPGIKVAGIPKTAQNWLEESDLADVDGIVMALGIPSLERSFAKAFRSRFPRLPVVFTWLEPLDIGGHSVLTWTKGEGCLNCLYRDDEGSPALYPRTSFLQPNQPVSKSLTGCASVFVPYGALQSRRTGLLAAEHMLDAVRGQTKNSYRYWVGTGQTAMEQGLEVTPWRDIARQISDEEATQRVFGRPCKRCREVK